MTVVDIRGTADVPLATRATGLLATFNAAGVLDLADVHTAATVARITGETDETVALALALTVRALRLGSVCVDLTTVAGDVFEAAEEGLEVADLPWPEPAAWLARCRASRALADGPDAADGRPLRLVAGNLYLERYWRQEEAVRRQLVDRRSAPPPAVDDDRLTAALDRLFTGEGLGADEEDLQRRAAEVCARQWVTVLAGGPGTGKTTTVAKVLAMLGDQPGRPPRIALAAPTGKAAARLSEALADARNRLDPEDVARVADLSAVTLHRLLGWLPSSRGRFRHHADNRLPYDVVVVDEMSMVSLTLMARLLEAVRPDARLVLVGDPDQLSSVEAGAVLADITGALASSTAPEPPPPRSSGCSGPGGTAARSRISPGRCGPRTRTPRSRCCVAAPRTSCSWRPICPRPGPPGSSRWPPRSPMPARPCARPLPPATWSPP